VAVIPRFARPRSITTDAASNWDDRWSAGYLTTQSRLHTIFPTLSDQKAVMTECAADAVVGREKEYANSFSIPVKEWGKSTVDCLDIVADASKSLRSWWNQEDIEGSDVLLIRRLDGKRSLEGRTRSRLRKVRGVSSQGFCWY